jgi:hypothetical protein
MVMNSASLCWLSWTFCPDLVMMVLTPRNPAVGKVSWPAAFFSDLQIPAPSEPGLTVYHFAPGAFSFKALVKAFPTC